MKLTFSISFLSDYHIKAGYGEGIIDSLILRDRNGFPIIRGTTLTGLLRQGMWDLLQLDLLKQHRHCRQSGSGGDAYCGDTDQTCPVCRILGSPLNPKKWRVSSAKVQDFSTLKAGKVIWRNRVNLKTRTAEARRLFTQEIMGGGISFNFTVENEQNNAAVLEEAAFIVAAFRMIRSIGASRRKGKGQCRFHLVDITPALPGVTEEKNTSLEKEKRMLDIFKTKWLENKELKTEEVYKSRMKQSIEPLTHEFPKEKRRKSFNLVLLTKEPLLIANRSEAGNRFHAIDYIPGDTILGALAWKIANKWDLTNEVIYEKFTNFFHKSGLRISPLYPCLKIENDIYPTIPAPLDFLTCKLEPLGFEDKGHGVWTFAAAQKEPKHCAKCLENNFETPLEPVNDFISFSFENPKKVTVAKREEMHITIDPQSGKTRTGELFSYTTIEEGQYFVGTIEVEDWDDFILLLGIDSSANSLELRVGKGSSRGYGLTQVWFNEGDTRVTFRGKSIEERIHDWSKPLIMTLLTDTILTDYWGRSYTALDCETLRQILGIDVEIINSFVKTKHINGFNIHLGVPKWRERAIAAGSSVGFKIKDSTQKAADLLERFKKLENEGIGLRRAEGFGQIVFNHPVYEQNFDFDVSIRLAEFMRIQPLEEKVKNFERWWQSLLIEHIQKHSFSQKEWVLLSRWLTENTKMFVATENMDELLEKFHCPGKMLELVNNRKPCREKKKFLEEEGQSGKKLLLQIFADLSHEIRKEDKDMQKYFLTRAIAMLVEFITSCQEVKQ